MTKLFTSLLALLVASAAGLASAQTPAETAPAPAAAAPAASAPGAVSIEAKAAMCVGCHGIPRYQASFPEVYRVPLISGQNAKYIAAALAAYKAGDRKHPSMRAIAAGLSEQDMNELSVWYEKQGAGELQTTAPSRQPSAAVAALLQKGACVSCHGANFANPIDAAYPKIAGQHKDYLYAALKSYKVENNPVVGRNNAIMGGIARQFSNAELKSIADYLGSLEGEMEVQPLHRFR